ncbi:Alb1-domain-containing protein [Xylariaceae sp. FL1651]|nr:Alb1-domain-containing protein [Xylariaceae sp. FL1651]
MAKGTVSKKKKAPSIHSRAARRATSPSIDTDKSLKDVQPPPEAVDHRPSVLAIHHGAGVSKRQKKGRAMSSKARKRHEKAQDRAAAVMERTMKKVAQSKDQSRNMISRKGVWEQINQKIPLNKAESRKKVDSDDNLNDSEFDDEMNEVEEERGSQPDDADNVDMRPAAETVVNHNDEDGIL